MNKKLLFIALSLLVVFTAVGVGTWYLFKTGASNPIDLTDERYVRSITYTLGEEKVVREETPAIDEYIEEILLGKKTEWGLSTRYVVGLGKDIEPGMYTVNTKGWAEFNIFIGSVDLKINNNPVGLMLSPLERNVCYLQEQTCSYYEYFQKITGLQLVEGDIVYASYSPYSGQSVNIRFEPETLMLNHPATDAKSEIKKKPVEIKETVYKKDGGYSCFINDIEANTCLDLKKFEELKAMF